MPPTVWHPVQNAVVIVIPNIMKIFFFIAFISCYFSYGNSAKALAKVTAQPAARIIAPAISIWSIRHNLTGGRKEKCIPIIALSKEKNATNSRTRHVAVAAGCIQKAFIIPPVTKTHIAVVKPQVGQGMP